MFSSLAADPQEGFDPAIATAALTLVPLVLITSALATDIIKGRVDLIGSTVGYKMKWRRWWWAVAGAIFMCGSSFTAIVLSLAELLLKTNIFDWLIIISSAFATFGVMNAIVTKIWRSLKEVKPRRPAKKSRSARLQADRTKA